jgi:hypothetical protein
VRRPFDAPHIETVMKPAVFAVAIAMLLAMPLAFAKDAPRADELFPADPRPRQPTLVLSGELQPDDPLVAQLLGSDAPAGVARPLRFERVLPYEVAPPTELQLQAHRDRGGVQWPDDPRPPSGPARPGTVRLNLLYCGWALYQGQVIPADIAYLYEYRVDDSGVGNWAPSGGQMRRLFDDDVADCRRGADSTPAPE